MIFHSTSKPRFYILIFILFILAILGIYIVSETIVSASEKRQTYSSGCTSQISPELCVKIGNMLIVGFGGERQDENGKVLWKDPNGTVFKENSDVAEAIKKHHVGGVILFSRPILNAKTKKYIRDHNITNPEQVQKLNKALQDYSLQSKKEAGEELLPLLITIDQEGGAVDRLPFYLDFPLQTFVAQALGANEEIVLHDPEKKQIALAATRNYAAQMAAELNENHFNVNFFPCVDVNINPINWVIGGRGRSFSYYPQVVADQALEFVKSFNEKGIVATLKHFPGHGSSSHDTHEGLVNITDSYQKDKELFPYQMLIKNGFQDMIMTTHVINGQIDNSQCKLGEKEDPETWCPATMSYTTITTLLRNKLGFKGVIVSDDLSMGAIAKIYPLELALEKTINAGVDMLILSNHFSNETEKVINTIAALVKEGKILPERIENANEHINKLKRRMINH